MLLHDLWSLLIETLRTQRLRSFLTILGIVIGMASVVLLSSIGEGTRQGIVGQFTQFGTTIIGVTRGKQRTFGVGPGMIGGTTHPLTLEDAEALRRIPGVLYVAPHIWGMGEVKAGERSRRTYIYGSTWDEQYCIQISARIGSFLPPGDPEAIPPVCVLGTKVARDLFSEANPLGAHIRVGESRFTVAGVLAPKGQVLGLDLDDIIIVPVRRAMKMFNRDEVEEIHILASSQSMIAPVSEGVTRILKERHDGEEDFTVVSQADMLKLVNEVIDVLTVGALLIAGISVFVGAMGILTIMWVSVHERTGEIGLIKALGASNRQVALMFLSEAGGLSLVGGVLGTALGAIGGWLLRAAVKGLWVETPFWILPVALAVSLGVGVLAGVVPAVRAARLDPVEALRTE